MNATLSVFADFINGLLSKQLLYPLHGDAILRSQEDMMIYEDNAAGRLSDKRYLDAYAPHELVQAIYVDAPDKSSGRRAQHIHIKYNGLGFIPLDKLTYEETA